MYGAWCTEGWVRDLEPSVGPDKYHNWILVAWAFRERAIFRKISKVLLLEGRTDGVGFSPGCSLDWRPTPTNSKWIRFTTSVERRQL